MPDYPKPGVMFKDITPLLADPAAFSALTDALADLSVRHGATKIVGLEARGFILGAPVAVRAGLGFVPVRKAGKLPGATLSQAYDLEYGSAEIEVHAEDLAADDRVMVIDDVLATGGTAAASVELIRRSGAEVAGVAVLMELGSSTAAAARARPRRGAAGGADHRLRRLATGTRRAPRYCRGAPRRFGRFPLWTRPKRVPGARRAPHRADRRTPAAVTAGIHRSSRTFLQYRGVPPAEGDPEAQDRYHGLFGA